ncbi:aldehyde dehydrogenase (NADP(+)) [Nannocystaceae bacterium ST9]
MHLIGDARTGDARAGDARAGGERWCAHTAAEGRPLAPDYADATPAEIDRALTLARAAQRVAITPERRADLLEAIATAIVELGPALLERCQAETGLPRARLEGERGRTCKQLEMFAALVREGSWVDARIDPAQPDRQPLPRPDLRRMLVAIGPVIVFAASNFPLAFSVAGGDTASAIAAGNVVIVKAHPSHPGTSEAIGEAMLAAGRALAMPEGWFSLLHGRGHAVGRALVQHPHARAVGFTGSLRGGRALMEAAMQRPDPIPVHAEMGSINPVFLLPAALARRAEPLADAAAASITMGVGQFCTKPGVLVVVRGEPTERFAARLAERLHASEPGVMLDARLLADYRERVAIRAANLGASLVAGPEGRAAPLVLRCTAERFAEQTELRDELFGPTSLLVECRDATELLALAEALAGQLASAIHAESEDPESEDAELQASLLAILRDRAGRVVFEGWPTGVEPCSAIQHGGPWPASSDARSTSVGSAAIARFARPVCVQNAPHALLPAELRDDNPRGLLRLIDGRPTRDPSNQD